MVQTLRYYGLQAWRSRPARWLRMPRRIPMYYAVTILASIFYHYAPSWTWFWVLSGLLIQIGLFRLFDFVKKHPFIGGACYVIAGMCTLGLAYFMMSAGYDGALLSPDDPTLRINFFVWFMTPQSVLATQYAGFTIALYLLFAFFIGSIVYYFTMVRYRVLMSFMTMLFPFAIYAKESETMPVPCIILLFAFYFGVMIYCRQAHAEDPDVTKPFSAARREGLVMPGKKSSFFGQRPEVLDGRFLKAGGIFLTGASIIVLLVPKPTVQADRQFLDTMLDLSALSDYLESAISGFAENTDGGNYTDLTFTRALYYVKADEPLNLRVLTQTDYSYSADAWAASSFDRQPAPDDYRYSDRAGFRSVAPDIDPSALVQLLHTAAEEHPDFAERWGLTPLVSETVESERYLRQMRAEASSYNMGVYPAPLDVLSVGLPYGGMYQSGTGVIFRYQQSRVLRENYALQYLSPTFADSAAAQAAMSPCSTATWSALLLDLQNTLDADDPLQETVQAAIDSCLSAAEYGAAVSSETPENIRALALELTADKQSDYDKAMAIRQYLKYGTFVYSLDFPITEQDNVETFLFQNRTGVCYQFASAMAELCRAAGLYTRFVEGYSMSQKYDRLTGDWDYIITTDHGHAWVDVFIAGYGWMSIDATAGSVQETRDANNVNVISTLQIAGFVMLIASLLALVLAVWLIPALREALFRRRFRRRRDAKAVQAAFARLRKQWEADPAETATVLCEKMGAYLQVDLSDLQQGFEETVYADRCSPETADRVYAAYCKAYDAFKPAKRRERKAEREAKRAARRRAAAAAKAV